MAAALFAHTIWDIVRRANRVVARSLAKWCAVLDSLLGIGILVVFLR